MLPRGNAPVAVEEDFEEEGVLAWEHRVAVTLRVPALPVATGRMGRLNVAAHLLDGAVELAFVKRVVRREKADTRPAVAHGIPVVAVFCPRPANHCPRWP